MYTHYTYIFPVYKCVILHFHVYKHWEYLQLPGKCLYYLPVLILLVFVKYRVSVDDQKRVFNLATN